MKVNTAVKYSFRFREVLKTMRGGMMPAPASRLFCVALVLNLQLYHTTGFTYRLNIQPAQPALPYRLTVQTGFSSEQLVELQPVLQCICDRFLDCAACSFWSEMLLKCELTKAQHIAIDLMGQGGPEWHHWLNNSNNDCGFVQCPSPRQNPPPEANEPAVKKVAWMKKCVQLTGVKTLVKGFSQTSINTVSAIAEQSLCNLPNYGAVKYSGDCGGRDLKLLHDITFEPEYACIKMMEESCAQRVGQPGHLEQCCSLHTFETSGFGNQLLQLTHSLRMARAHGCKVLCLPDCHAGTMDTVECGGADMWHQSNHTNAKSKTIHLMSTFDLPITLIVPPTVPSSTSRKPDKIVFPGALCASGWRTGMMGATGWYQVTPPPNVNTV